MNYDKIDAILAEAGCRFEFLHGKDYEDFSPYKFAELIVREIVKDLEVEGCDFSYNESNNYGVISTNFFVDGDPERMRGPEVQQKYRDGIRGSGYYRLNEQFVKYLIDRAFGVKE